MCNFVSLNGLQTFSHIVFYYCFSIGLTFYQKWMVQGFQYPLSMVIFHMVSKFLFAWMFRSIYSHYTKTPRVTLKWRSYVTKIAVPGITSGLDIGLSNWSFEFITLSLYTMTKSTAIIFILLFSIVLGLETMKWSLVVVILQISTGLLLFTYKSTQFDLEGFLLVLMASFLSGIRWSFTQFVMQRSELGLNHPIDMMYHIQPWMIITLLPLAVVFEGLHISTSEILFRSVNLSIPLMWVFKLWFGSVLAFFMEVSEYLVVSSSSGLTLSIAGIVKEIFILILAVLINKDVLALVNGIGLVMCLSGITLHVILKYKHSLQLPEKEKEQYPLLSASDEEDVLFESKFDR